MISHEPKAAQGEPKKPYRVQLRRGKGWRMPENTVKVDRTTKWGNPYPVTEFRSAEDAVEAFRSHLPTLPHFTALCQRELRGKNLACWCPLDQWCHADVLLAIANGDLPDFVPSCEMTATE